MKAGAWRARKFRDANEQLEKDKESLRIFATRKLQGKIRKDLETELFTYPGFVIMPECQPPVETVVDTTNGIFSKDFENVEAFSKWCDKNIKRAGTAIEEDLFKLLVMR